MSATNPPPEISIGSLISIRVLGFGIAIFIMRRAVPNCGLEINLSFKQHLHPESSLLHVESTRFSRNCPCLPQQSKLCIQVSYEQVIGLLAKTHVH